MIDEMIFICLTNQPPSHQPSHLPSTISHHILIFYYIFSGQSISRDNYHNYDMKEQEEDENEMKVGGRIMRYLNNQQQQQQTGIPIGEMVEDDIRDGEMVDDMRW